MRQTRRSFTKKFKVDAVQLVTEQGYKASEEAGNLGISTSVLRRWRGQLEKQAHQAFPGKGFRTPEKQEQHRLRKEVKRLDMEREIFKKGRRLLRQSVEAKFDFIRQHMKAYPVAVLCAVMRVSRSGYYQFLKYASAPAIDPDFFLITKVRQIHSDNRATFGSRRMSKQLRDEGHDVGRHRARTLMKKAGIAVKRRRRVKRTTDSKHNQPVAPNLAGSQI